TPANLENGPAVPVTELLPDPQGRYVLALSGKESHYYLIATDAKLAARKIEIDKPLRCACLADGRVCAVREEPARIDKSGPASGRGGRTSSVGPRVQTPRAVGQRRGRACFPAKRMVHPLDLTSGAVVKTDIPGHAVAGDPSQRFIYSWIKPENRRD